MIAQYQWLFRSIFLFAILGWTSSSAHAGKVVISSQPSGARIYLDGIQKGVTPTHLDLSSGQYHVEIRYNGFLTWTSYVMVPHSADLNVRVSLQRAKEGHEKTEQPLQLQNQAQNETSRSYEGKGLLMVQTEPSGVGVYLDKQYLGLSPLLVHIPLGSQEITLRQAGYSSVRRTVTISRTKAFHLKATMRSGESEPRGGANIPKLPGSGSSTMLMIVSTPPARVHFDGTDMGETPFLSSGLLAGTYSIRLVAQGYQSYHRSIRLHPGQQLNLKIHLVPSGSTSQTPKTTEKK